MADVQSPKNANDVAEISQNEEQAVQSKVEELRKQHPSMFSEDESVNENYTQQFEREQQQLELASEEEQEVSPKESEEQPDNEKPKADADEDQKDSLPSLDELDLPEDLGLPGSEEGEVPELPDTEEAKQFAKQFQEYLGVSVEEFRAAAQDYKKTIEYVNQVRAENYYRQSIQSLSNEWGIGGEEVESRLETIRERFNKYPKEMRDKLDSPEGAKLIWAKIEQEQKKQQPEVPTFQKSTPGSPKNAGGKKPLFTREQLEKMTPEEYAANNDKIIEAYQLGLVR